MCNQKAHNVISTHKVLAIHSRCRLHRVVIAGAGADSVVVVVAVVARFPLLLGSLYLLHIFIHGMHIDFTYVCLVAIYRPYTGTETSNGTVRLLDCS